MISGLGNPSPFLGEYLPLAEGAALGKASSEKAAREHRDQMILTETLMEQCALETRHVLSEKLRRPISAIS